MKLVNNTTGAHYWAFARASETVAGQKVGHLWNYGLNTGAGKTRTAAAIATSTTWSCSSISPAPSGHGWLV